MDIIIWWSILMVCITCSVTMMYRWYLMQLTQFNYLAQTAFRLVVIIIILQASLVIPLLWVYLTSYA